MRTRFMGICMQVGLIKTQVKHLCLSPGITTVNKYNILRVIVALASERITP